MTIRPPESGGCSGYCQACTTTHRLPPGRATQEARLLQRRLEDQQTIDLWSDGRNGDPELSTDLLFGPQRGKMFGVLEYQAVTGQSSFLYSFSGQYNGRCTVPGWAPPLFDIDLFKKVHDPVERRIKQLGAQIELQTDKTIRQDLSGTRKHLSRQLMKRIHGLYRLHNFSGRSASLNEAVGTPAPLPNGIGDCCAPKLLNQAAELGFVPLSIAEFYFGRNTPSGTRHHGNFYEPCPDKCSPILGFLLCGAPSLL
jgi:hypothetical protein